MRQQTISRTITSIKTTVITAVIMMKITFERPRMQSSLHEQSLHGGGVGTVVELDSVVVVDVVVDEVDDVVVVVVVEVVVVEVVVSDRHLKLLRGVFLSQKNLTPPNFC